MTTCGKRSAGVVPKFTAARNVNWLFSVPQAMLPPGATAGWFIVTQKHSALLIAGWAYAPVIVRAWAINNTIRHRNTLIARFISLSPSSLGICRVVVLR